MHKSLITFDTAQQIALALPGVEKSLAYGSPALKVHGQLLACIPTNSSAEPDSLLVRVDLDTRAELLTSDSAAYYLPDHYINYTGVLVRLSQINRDTLHGLLAVAHKFVTRRLKQKPQKPGRR